jgi:hypothetical protein
VIGTRRLLATIFATSFVAITVVSIILASRFDILRVNGNFYACNQSLTKKNSENFPYWELQCEQLAFGNREIIRIYFISTKDVVDMATRCGLDSRLSLVILSRFFMKDIVSYILVNKCERSFRESLKHEMPVEHHIVKYYYQGNSGIYLWDTVEINSKNRTLPLLPFMSVEFNNTKMYYCAKELNADIFVPSDIPELLPLKEMITNCRI